MYDVYVYVCTAPTHPYPHTPHTNMLLIDKQGKPGMRTSLNSSLQFAISFTASREHTKIFNQMLIGAMCL